MPLRTGSSIPAIDGATDWLGEVPNIHNYQGKLLLIHFWAMSCHICHDNAPKIQQWRDEYADKGLNFIAVHMPKSESDTDVDQVTADLTNMKITEPCAIDNEHAIADAFDNRFVPAYFLFDKEGKLRSRTAGDAGLNNMETTLKRLIES